MANIEGDLWFVLVVATLDLHCFLPSVHIV